MGNTVSRTEMLMKVKIKDVMTEKVITIDYDDLIGKASRMMLENHVHSLLVLKYGKPAYMITTYDLIKVSYEDTFSETNADLLKTTVEELVKGQSLRFLSAGDPLVDALRMFVEYNIHSIPILEDNKVSGIVTLMDLAKWYTKTHEEISRHR